MSLLYPISSSIPWNRKTVLIALPGLGGTASSFPINAFRAIADAGVLVYLADYNSHVESINMMAAYIWEAYNATPVSTVHPILLGYSMGGFVAQSMYAQQLDRVKGMILLSTACMTIDDGIAAAVTYSDLGKRALSFVHEKRHSEKPFGLPPRAIVSEDDWFNELAAVIAYVLSNKSCERLTNVQCPVLSIYGLKDTIIPVSSMSKLEDIIPAKMFTKAVFPHATHGLIYEQPEEVGSTVLKWIAANSM